MAPKKSVNDIASGYKQTNITDFFKKKRKTEGLVTVPNLYSHSSSNLHPDIGSYINRGGKDHYLSQPAAVNTSNKPAPSTISQQKQKQSSSGINNNIENEQNQISKIKIVSYNIAGLRNKLDFGDFFKFVKEHDIFFLFETFITREQIVHFKKYFSEYNLHWIPAIQVHNSGRAIGGSLFGFKNNVSGDFTKVNNQTCFVINNLGKKYFIVPTYLNCNFWNKDFNALDDCLRSLQYQNIMLIGDFNARIGNKQIVSDESNCMGIDIAKTRNSKDQTINRNGRLFMKMCQANDLCILNGCSTNDPLGEFTFIRGSSKSVIDFCAISSEWMKITSSFVVGANGFSDHMPLLVQLGHNNIADHYEIPLPPKPVWKNNLKESCSTKLLSQNNKTFEITFEHFTEEKICFLTSYNYYQSWFHEELSTAMNLFF